MPAKKKAKRPSVRHRPSGARQVEKRPLYTDADKRREIALSNPEPYRSEWRRDFARIIHCPAFRRQQGKLQLFPGSETDFFRNRLTHSLEVAQIAKSITNRLNGTIPFFQQSGFAIDTDLVEAAALVHDIGHPPFGHTGEAALDFCMKDKGGFEGNAQTLRILARLEKRERRSYASPSGILAHGVDGRVGLNLCHRTLAAVLKYDKEIEYDRALSSVLDKGYYRCEHELVARIKKSVTGQKILQGNSRPLNARLWISLTTLLTRHTT